MFSYVYDQFLTQSPHSVSLLTRISPPPSALSVFNHSSCPPLPLPTIFHSLSPPQNSRDMHKISWQVPSVGDGAVSVSARASPAPRESTSARARIRKPRGSPRVPRGAERIPSAARGGAANKGRPTQCSAPGGAGARGSDAPQDSAARRLITISAANHHADTNHSRGLPSMLTTSAANICAFGE